MKHLKYAILKWLGVIKYPEIRVNGFFGMNFNYNRLTILSACYMFIKQWRITYGHDIEYIFHGLVIDFNDTPIKGLDGKDNYGITDIYRIVIWKNSPHLGDTALVHELIHYVKMIRTGDPDNKHEGCEWGENFESPVKRIINFKD